MISLREIDLKAIDADLQFLEWLDTSCAVLERQAALAALDATSIGIIRDGLRFGRRDTDETLDLLLQTFPALKQWWLRSRNSSRDQAA